MTPVSVLLPVCEAGEHFEGALGSVRAQTHAELDVLVVLNGAAPATRDLVSDAARDDERIRVVELPEANLAAALNEGMRIARFDLVARMDADDVSAVDRIERQVAWLADRPRVMALGTAFARISPDGEVLEEVYPPSDPRDVRWRLLAGNIFCHGSMMLRRGAVLGAGGYNETCLRSQDYELWMRLSRTCDLANLPDVLYLHRLRARTRRISPDAWQAATDARVMSHYWRALRAGDAQASRVVLEPLLRRAMADGEGAGPPIAELEQFLRAGGPSREGLIAWLWAQLRHARAQVEVMRASRVREVVDRLRAGGVHAVYLWGAGAHTQWLLDRRDELGLRVLGVVDDHRAGVVIGEHRAIRPDQLRVGEHVLISTDMYEPTIWRSSASHRARGVHVWRLYAPEHRVGEGDAIPLAV